MGITREIFDKQRNPRFGKMNPERMNCEFWEWMINAPANPPKEGDRHSEVTGLFLRSGKLKSVHGPWKARDYFDVPLNPEEGPIWTAHERMGQTRTKLSDGRIVFVGGECEDSGDPDFYIYNDVIVFGKHGLIDIYGYPRDIFPPTDSHTATLIGDRLIIIGSWGYAEDCIVGFTPVYEIDLTDFHIEKISTSGDAPGWLHDHKAKPLSDGKIIVTGGKYKTKIGDTPRFRFNCEDYSLDTETGTWRRLTDRNWRQISIRIPWGSIMPSVPSLKDIFLPINVDYRELSEKAWDEVRISVKRVPITITIDYATLSYDEVLIIFKGVLPDGLAIAVAEDIQKNIEATIQQPCVLELE
jgi:hypothetical protein